MPIQFYNEGIYTRTSDSLSADNIHLVAPGTVGDSSVIGVVYTESDTTSAFRDITLTSPDGDDTEIGTKFKDGTQVGIVLSDRTMLSYTIGSSPVSADDSTPTREYTDPLHRRLRLLGYI